MHPPVGDQLFLSLGSNCAPGECPIIGTAAAQLDEKATFQPATERGKP